MDKINGWGEGGETVKLATSDRQAKWREQMRKTPSRRKHLFPLNAAIFRVLKIRKKKIQTMEYRTDITFPFLNVQTNILMIYSCSTLISFSVIERVLKRKKKSKQLKMELASRSLFERANKYVDVFLLDTDFFFSVIKSDL